MLGAAVQVGAMSLAAQTKMQGGCGAYSIDLGNEMRLMAGEAVKVEAGRDVAGAPAEQTGQAMEVHLRPQTEVELAAAPAQDRGGAERKAGLVRLTSGVGDTKGNGELEAGDWRVSVDRFVWVDLVGSGQLMESGAFAMERDCPTIFKTVVFHVPEAMPAVLELTGASEGTVRVVVTRAK